jgi:hypothetical protein
MKWVKNISYYIIKANAAAESWELEKRGWMLINGKAQWFALRKGGLYWFPQEQNADFPEPDNDRRVRVGECQITVLRKDTKFAFQILTKGGRKFELRCNSEAELNEWIDALGRSREKAHAAAAVSPLVPTFGTPLAKLCAFEKQELPVPLILKRCLAVLQDARTKSGVAGLFQQQGSFPTVFSLSLS